MAELRFALKDYLHHTWRDELVCYRVAQGEVPAPARLIGPGSRAVPVQVRPLPDGEVEVAFVVDELPADGEATYTLVAGAPVGGNLVEAQGGALILDSGRIAVRLPGAGEWRFEKPVPLAQVPPPLLALRGTSGQWLGQGCLAGRVGVESMKTFLVASGPVYAEVRADYTLKAGTYSMRVRLVRGQEAVLVWEEFDTGPEAVENAYFQFAFSGEAAPGRVAAQGRPWRQRQDQKDSPAGTDYALEYGADHRELAVIGYVPWWPESVRLVTLHAFQGGESLSFFPRRIGAWRNPMGSYLEVRRERTAFFSLPLYVKQEWAQDGLDPRSPYYTGKLEEGWPVTAGRRQWAFFLSTEEEVFPVQGRSALAEAIIRHSDLPLDKVKDWVFDWDGTPVQYPRLYVEPGKLDPVRQRALQAPGWNQDLEPHFDLPLSYLLQPDPHKGEELLYGQGQTGALPGLRRYVASLFDEWGYVGFAAPNNAQPMLELVRFDAAMSVAEATPAEKEEMRRLAAFVAQMVWDQDWHPTLAGWHLGNPNMPPRQEHHLAIASVVLPFHPLAKAWRQRGLEAQQRLLEEMVKPSGAWRECPHYELDAAMFPLFQAAVPFRLANVNDLFAEVLLKKTWDFLVDILTPPDPRFASNGRRLRVLPAFGNGSWEFMPLLGWLGSMTRESAPAFSKRMMWAWQEQGRPDYYQMSRLIIDPDLPGEQPHLQSVNYPGFGCVLRSGFPSADETWMAFRHGDCIEHYNYGDQGSFMLFAKGAPLVLHFGSQYTPYFQGAWYFNRACVNHRLLTPQDSVALERPPSDYALGTELYYTEFWDEEEQPDYPMRNRAFVRLEAADYARGEQVQSWQGVNGKDHTVRLPPNSPIPKVEIPRHTWVRRVLFLKDPDPEGPNYFLVRDDFVADDPLPGEWNIWTLAEGVDLSAMPAKVTSRYGVELEVYMAEPTAPRWSTSQDTNRFLAGPSRPYLVDREWVEVLTNLRAYQEPGKGFLAVLYPRKHREPVPEFETLAGGRGVKVSTPRGVDYAFLSQTPVAWSGDGLSFAGTAGAIRQVGERWEVVFAEPGRAEVAGQTITATGPLQQVVTH